ncbi:MAG: hypothetical protein RR420_05480 [Anaerovoracaceae bacterium]
MTAITTEEEFMEQEREKNSTGVLTMMLEFNQRVISRLSMALMISIVINLLIVGGFLWYLSGYDIEVSHFGNLEGSNKINTSEGVLEQNATTINNGSK